MRIKWIYISIGIVLILGGFYWFQLRPVEMKKECHKDTVEFLKKQHSVTKRSYDEIYELCLNSKGF